MASVVIGVIVLTPDDWQLWRDMRQAALAEAPAAFGSTLQEWTGAGDLEERWRARLDSVALNIVLTWNDEPAAMVSATVPGEDGSVELISLWVAPFARGHGLGDAAIRRVLTWARSVAGSTRVVLSVKTSNHQAIALYGRNGFTAAGPSRDGADEQQMIRSLASDGPPRERF